MIGSAIIIDHRMLEGKLTNGACTALLTLLVSVSVYFVWIANLFFHDELGPLNYHPALWVIRMLVLISSAYLFFSVLQNQGPLISPREGDPK